MLAALDIPTTGRTYATARRQRGWVLLIAILPTLTFLGHWPRIEIPLPGTGAHVVLPFLQGDHVAIDQADTVLHNDGPTARPHEHEEDHGRHCHANAASCSDVPFTGASAFAMMHAAAASIGAESPATAIATTWWQPHGAFAVDPEIQPPRAASFAV